MKAKLILTAMAMPVLFAACTSDELVPMEEVQQVQRPLLSENFRMTAEIEAKGDAETRYAVSENEKGSLNFTWTEGDEYAAALIDEAKGKDPEMWGIIPSSGTITRFTYNEGTKEWNFLENTGVGHYLFSYKYNPDDVLTRGAVSYSLEAVQKITSDDLNAEIKRSNKAVASALLRGESAKAQLKNLFAYPKFKIQFENSLPVSSVQKVVLEKKSGFQIAGGYNHNAVWNMFNQETIDKAIEDGTYDNEEEYWASKQTNEFIINTGETLGSYGDLDAYTEIKTSDYIVAEFTDGAAVKTESDGVTNNKYVEVRFMIPGELVKVNNKNIVNDDYNMYVYTNNGVYKIENVLQTIEFNNNTATSLRKRVIARNTSYTLKLNRILAGQKTDADFHIVTDVNDWNDLVEEAKDMEKGTTLNVKAVGEDFSLDGTAAMPENVIFNVDTELHISGTQALSNVKVETVVVDATGVLTPKAGFEATTINNYGNIALVGRKKAYTLVNKNGGQTTVNNFGTVTVGPKADVTLTLNSKKDVVTGKVGTFKNNGIATVTLTAENKSKTTNAAGATMNLMNGGSNDGNFTNDGLVVLTETVSTVAAFKNTGSFTNNSGAEVKKDNWYGAFENTGKVYVMDGSKGFSISSNSGAIILEKANMTTGYDPVGDVVYYAKNETVSKAANKYLDKLYVSGNVTLSDNEYTILDSDNSYTKGSLDEIIVEKSANLTVSKNHLITLVTVEKEAELTITSTVATISTLNLKEESAAYVQKGNTVTVGTLTVGTDAMLYVGGKFTAGNKADQYTEGTHYEKIASGATVSFTGTTNKYDAVTTAKTNYDNAVIAVIKAFWKSQSSHAGGNTANDKYNDGYANWCKIVDTDPSETEDNRFDIAATIAQSKAMYDETDNRSTPETRKAYEDVVNTYNVYQKALIAYDGSGKAGTHTFADIAVNDAEKFKTENKTFVEAMETEVRTAVETAVTAGKIVCSSVWAYVYVDKLSDYKEMYAAYNAKLKGELGTTWMVDDPTTTGAGKDENGDTDLNSFRLYKYSLDKIFSTMDATAPAVATAPKIKLPANAYLDANTSTDVYKAMKLYKASKDLFSGDNSIDFDDSSNVTLKNLQDWLLYVSLIVDKDLSDINAYNARTEAKRLIPIVAEWGTPVYTDARLQRLASLIP